MEWTALWDKNLAITRDVQDFLECDQVRDVVEMMPALHKKLNQCPDNIPFVLNN